MRTALRENDYCSGWASSPRCKMCVKWASKYDFRTFDPTMIDRGAKAPTIYCRNFSYDKERKKA